MDGFSVVSKSLQNFLEIQISEWIIRVSIDIFFKGSKHRIVNASGAGLSQDP